jgi:phage N-6-adenine-methyltransferase
MLPEDDVRETPSELFESLHERFDFTLDVCATHANAKCDAYFTECGEFLKSHISDEPYVTAPPGVNGLTGSWVGNRAWCNPPFSDIVSWVLKAWDSGAELVVMLVPATRTEQPWWQDAVERLRDGKVPPSELPGGWSSFTTEFLQGRTHFLKDGKPILDPKTGRRSSPKFGCVLLIWQR